MYAVWSLANIVCQAFSSQSIHIIARVVVAQWDNRKSHKNIVGKHAK